MQSTEVMNFFCSLGAGGLLGVTPPALRQEESCTNFSLDGIPCQANFWIWVVGPHLRAPCFQFGSVGGSNWLVLVESHFAWCVLGAPEALVAFTVRLLYLLTAFGIPTWGFLLPADGCASGCFQTYCRTGCGQGPCAVNTC